eukprot:1155773-Pelagomonas_calceolata.AAC.3
MAYTQGSPLASTGCCSDHHLIRALRTWVSAVKSLENRVSGYQDDHAKQRVVEVGVAGKLLRADLPEGSLPRCTSGAYATVGASGTG